MARFQIQDILSITSGQLVGYSDEYTLEMHVDGICTDSRALQEGALFLALVGQKFDGHHYCQNAFDAGARFFLLSEASYLPDKATGIIVKDTLLALQTIANYYRKKMGCTVLAVTGSVGKTSTRQMLETAFSSVLKTHATKGNNNNEIGMPLTILSAPEDTELLILEMGMRLKGEIRELTLIAQPDIAVVTNIGVSHIARLGSRKDILEAKMEICDGLRAQGLLIVNNDDPMLKEYVNRPSNRTWRFLGKTSFSACEDIDLSSNYNVHAEKIELFTDQTIFDGCMHFEGIIHKFTCRLRVVGAHHVRNALIAILCAARLQQDVEKVINALEGFVSVGGRGNIIQTKYFTIFDDAYNASPESMAAAFESVKQIAKNRRIVAALGGILELGDYAPEIHEQVGIKASQAGFDTIYICGDNKLDFKKGFQSVPSQSQIRLFEDKDSLIEALLADLRKDDVIIIKASNSFGFGSFSEKIIEQDQILQREEEEGAF